MASGGGGGLRPAGWGVRLEARPVGGSRGFPGGRGSPQAVGGNGLCRGRRRHPHRSERSFPGGKPDPSRAGRGALAGLPALIGGAPRRKGGNRWRPGSSPVSLPCPAGPPHAPCLEGEEEACGSGRSGEVSCLSGTAPFRADPEEAGRPSPNPLPLRLSRGLRCHPHSRRWPQHGTPPLPCAGGTRGGGGSGGGERLQ